MYQFSRSYHNVSLQDIQAILKDNQSEHSIKCDTYVTLSTVNKESQNTDCHHRCGCLWQYLLLLLFEICILKNVISLKRHMLFNSSCFYIVFKKNNVFFFYLDFLLTN